MRFGVGGGGRIVRGGVSVGKGGVGGGVGAGPFSLRGGLGGGSGSGSILEMFLILAGIFILSVLFAALTALVFLVVAIALQIQLASLAFRHHDLSSVTPRQDWIWKNRWGILHTYIVTGFLFAMGFIFWTSSQDKLDACETETKCADALSRFHQSVFIAVLSFILGAVGIATLILTLRSVLVRRQDWKTEKAATNDVYRTAGRWYASIPRNIKERRWNELKFSPWSRHEASGAQERVDAPRLH